MITTRRWMRIILWLLVVLWMGVIFSLSAQTAGDSEATSGRVIRFLLAHLDRSFLQLSPEEQLLRMGAWSFAVRKLAHCAIFAGLGFLCLAAFSVDLPPRRAFPAAVLLGCARGVLDEVHQSFVPGRSCELRDMGIDCAGVLLGASFLLFLLLIAKHHKNKKA